MDDISCLDQFNYELPEKHIANEPLEKRDTSRLLCFNRHNGQILHKHFYNIVQELTEKDVLVLNQSKVFPARLFGKIPNGKEVEILLFQQLNTNTWKAITHPGLRPEMEIIFPSEVTAKVVMGDKKTGEVDLTFSFPHENIFLALEQIGKTPIPSYIKTPLSEQQLRKRYQTVYAKKTGSAAAPTAGLHFTQELLQRLQNKGVQIEYITLHVGLGTFQSLRKENFENKKLHTEYYEIEAKAADKLNQAKQHGKRIIAVGTTTMRTIESNISEYGEVKAGQGATELFILPPHKFKFIDSLITNFHLPQSSLLMLISAFAASPNTPYEFTSFSESRIGKAYQQAIKNNYRFYSFGDAMWIY